MHTKPQWSGKGALVKNITTDQKNIEIICFEKLDLGWSPQQIAGRLRKEIKDGKRSKEEYINHESIYQYIYDQEQREVAMNIYHS
jgi:IS30 family transposase